MKAKSLLRKQISQLFSVKTREFLFDYDKTITQKVIQYIYENNFKHICIYENLIDEVDTLQLIHTLREDNKVKIYTPQVIGETEMILIDEDYELYDKEIDAFITPGRAFTQDGKRLGRGKGYYDRFLSQKSYKKSKKIGICYDFQILPDIKTEKHDINMDLLITN